VSWANHFPEGTESLNDVPVHRFAVKRPRDAVRFARASRDVLGGGRGEREELAWLEEEGPFSPRLVKEIERRRTEFDHWLFFSYRYYSTYHGLRAASDRALLVPTAEDDGVYNLKIFQELFHRPRAIVWNSVEEKAMIEAASGCTEVPGDVVGVGSALPEALDAAAFRASSGFTGPFVLYVGRIDENKGCRELFTFFRRYREETSSQLRLALVGKAVLPIPDDAGIVHLGFLSDAAKWNAIAACDALVMPSRYESLSMVTLEAWWAGRPVLANAKCAVLRGQCQRSNAGLYYSGYDEFRESLAVLEAAPELRARLGENGRRYFDANYAWDVVERKYLALFERVRSAS
jgi:glycosyltransferase involved in cell wall biosynthesis